jgi:hypothetical protein
LRLLGLSAAEADDTLLEWNERNGIGLPADELHNIARSAASLARDVTRSMDDSTLVLVTLPPNRLELPETYRA